MKISELIEQLRELPQDCEVYIWLPDGERLPIKLVDADPAFVEDGFVDINTKEWGEQ
jgi:hypothetical protein